MQHTGISSSVGGIAVVVDDGLVIELLWKFLRALVSVHVWGILVDGSARSVNHVGHGVVIKLLVGRSVRDFRADGQVDIFYCRRDVFQSR